MLESILNKIGERRLMDPLNIDSFLLSVIDTGFEHLADSLRKVRRLSGSIVTVAVRLLRKDNLPLVLESLIYSSATSVTFLRENWQNVGRLSNVVSSRCLKGVARLL
jgi:hypothetical protein